MEQRPAASFQKGLDTLKNEYLAGTFILTFGYIETLNSSYILICIIFTLRKDSGGQAT